MPSGSVEVRDTPRIPPKRVSTSHRVARMSFHDIT
jgi:hypothetical protein